MKFKIAIFITLIAFTLATDTNSLFDKAQNSQEACQDKCATCQRTVYHLKFNNLSGCDNLHCRNVCYNIESEWNKEGNVYKAFKDDIFGKCEICFRAGFCSIAECKIQQEKELEVINNIVNKSALTGKKEDIIAKLGLEEFPGNLNSKDTPSTADVLSHLEESGLKIKKDLAKRLEAALSIGSVAEAANKVQDLIDANFSKSSTFSKTELSNNKEATVDNTKPKSEEANKEIAKKEEEALKQYKEASDKLIKQSEELLSNGVATQEQKDGQLAKLREGIKNNENLEKLTVSASYDKAGSIIGESKTRMNELIAKFENNETLEVKDKNETKDKKDKKKDKKEVVSKEVTQDKKAKKEKITTEKKNRRKKRRNNYY